MTNDNDNMPFRNEVTEVDNRDSRTTWLWISPQQYVEVDPIELIQNMIENCAHVITDPEIHDEATEIPVTADELNEALEVLLRV